MPPRLDLSGKTFGSWTVKHSEGSSRQGQLWRVVCKCGKEAVRPAAYLIQGRSKSCRNCKEIKKLPLEQIREGRQRGTSINALSKKYGVCPATIRRKLGGPDGRQPNWMWRHFSHINAARERGQTWKSLLKESPYRSCPDIIQAFSREKRRRLSERWAPRARTWLMTQRGMSAAEVAKELCAAERSVARWRQNPPPEIDMGRIRMLQARGVDWQSIWSRLGYPTEDALSLRVWFELLDADEAEAFAA